MRVASIDIGSYSVRLSVGEIENGNLRIILDKGKITALGQKVKETGFLQEDRILETLRVLEEYKEYIEKLGVDKVIVVGTEALRKAKNGWEFVKRVEEEIGFRIEIIPPEEEGKLAYLGAAFSLKVRGRNCVVDQGGGSTEYIFGKDLEVESIHSFPFGIVNLTETFLKHDPPTDKEVETLSEFLEKEIRKVKRKVDNLIGLGGTITTLAALEYNVYPYNPEEVHGRELTYDQIKKWFEELRSIPARERSKRYKQVEDKRAEVILAGIMIFLKTLEVFEREKLIVSDWGLREGVIIREFLKTAGGGKSPFKDY